MTQQYRWTEPEFTNAMKAACAERGEDYVYPGDPKRPGTCFYRHMDGSCGCLIGLAVFKLDPDLILPEADACTALRGLVPDHVRDAAHAAQKVQDGYNDDGRGPWGEALAVYLDRLVNPDPFDEYA